MTWTKNSQVSMMLNNRMLLPTLSRYERTDKRSDGTGVEKINPLYMSTPKVGDQTGRRKVRCKHKRCEQDVFPMSQNSIVINTKRDQ